MSPHTWRYVIAAGLFVHGVGHTMGVIAALGIGKPDILSSHSWLLSDRLGDNAVRAVCFILFLTVCVGFMGVTLSLLDWVVPHDWWRPLAVVFAIMSLGALAVFWNAFAALFPNKIGAMAVNGAILVGVLIAHWPTEADIGF